MPLSIFKETAPGVFEEISSDSSFTNPLTTVHNGSKQESKEIKLFVGRPSGNTNSFKNIRLTAISTSGQNDIDPNGSNPSGWGVKLLLDPGYTPTDNNWATVSYGNELTFNDITDDTKQAFWIKIESPAGISVGTKRNIALLLKFTEY